MATSTGKLGVIKIGATAIAQVRSWTIESSADPVEHSVIGNTWREFQSSMSGYTVQVEGYYDVTDTAQAALLLGTSVAFELFPAGEVSLETEFSGNAYVTSVNNSAAFDGMVEFTASLQGTGALVTGTVA